MYTCVNYFLFESVSKCWVTLLTQNMFKQPATHIHTSKLMATCTVLRVRALRTVFHLTPRVTSYICTVRTSKLTATCIYTAWFDSLSTESNILTRVTFKGVAAFSSAHYTQ